MLVQLLRLHIYKNALHIPSSSKTRIHALVIRSLLLLERLGLNSFACMTVAEQTK